MRWFLSFDIFSSEYSEVSQLYHIQISALSDGYWQNYWRKTEPMICQYLVPLYFTLQNQTNVACAIRLVVIRKKNLFGDIAVNSICWFHHRSKCKSKEGPAIPQYCQYVSTGNKNLSNNLANYHSHSEILTADLLSQTNPDFFLLIQIKKY